MNFELRWPRAEGGGYENLISRAEREEEEKEERGLEVGSVFILFVFEENKSERCNYRK